MKRYEPLKPNVKLTNNKREVKLQNPPPASTYPGTSQPQMSPPSYPYAAPQPGPVQPVSLTDGAATGALVLGILTALGTPFLMSYIDSMLSDARLYGVSSVYSNGFILFIILFLIGSMFALSSIACGRAGQIKSKFMGGYGAGRASFGLACGYFYFFSTFIMILFCIWVTAYNH